MEEVKPYSKHPNLRTLGADWKMDWQEYIHSNSNILVGKPVVKGTRRAQPAVGGADEDALFHGTKIRGFSLSPPTSGCARTRLSVEFLLGLFAAGWTETQVLESYPGLTSEGLRAVFAFAADCMRDLSFYAISPREDNEVSGE